MIVWVLLTALHFQAAMAFPSHQDCVQAATQLKVAAQCIAFAADIPDGKTL